MATKTQPKSRRGQEKASDGLDALRELATDPRVQKRYDGFIGSAIEDHGFGGPSAFEPSPNRDFFQIAEDLTMARTAIFMVAAKKALMEKLGIQDW